MASIREVPSKARRFKRIGAESSLRYSVQLLSLAAQNARALNRKK